MTGGSDASRATQQAGKSKARAITDILDDYCFDRGIAGPPKLVAKALLLVWRYRSHRRWLRVLGGATTRRILAVDPRMAFRHASRYLYFGLTWKDRIALMTAHYAFLNRMHDAPFFNQVIEPAGCPVWRHVSSGTTMTIALVGPAPLREGDLSLDLSIDGLAVFRVAFSILPGAYFGLGDGEPVDVLYIGQVQGAAGQLDRIRRTTRLCGDVAPQDLLMSALAGAASAWGIDRILGAGPARHYSVGKLSASAHAFDYVAFWGRYHAILNDEGHYVMTLPFPQKPISRIVSRHRKRTSIKRAFKDIVSRRVAAVIDGHRASRVGPGLERESSALKEM